VNTTGKPLDASLDELLELIRERGFLD